MILQTTTHKIKYIAIDIYCYCNPWDSPYVTKNDLKDYVVVTDLGLQPENGAYWYTYGNKWNHPKIIPSNANGIFLGEISDINNEINKKINPSDPSTFKKVYFDPTCKYPRFKLSSLTNIKKCLDFIKADTVIISQPYFESYKIEATVDNEIREDVLILYSRKNDTYYFIDYYPNKLCNLSENPKFQALLSKYADLQSVGLHRWASALIGGNILPPDCKKIYYGKVILTDTINIQFINNLFTQYKLITYDTELDRFISATLQRPTMEDLKTIGRMLSSTDNSVVGMGLKLLSNYDISTSICLVGTLIAQNWWNIISSSVSKSTGFEQVLRTLGLTRSELYHYELDRIINALYKNSTDKEDKEKARDIIKQKVIAEIQRDWESKYAKKFTNLDLNFKFTIE